MSTEQAELTQVANEVDKIVAETATKKKPVIAEEVSFFTSCAFIHVFIQQLSGGRH